MAYSLTYLLPESDSWQWRVWTLMAAELWNLKRWCRERVQSHLRLRETLDTSILKIVKFAAEDSWRGASNNLKVIVPVALSHVCGNSKVVVRVGNEATARQRVGKVVRLWRPSWGEVRNNSNRWRRCVVDWTVFVRWTPVRESSEVNGRLRIATSCSTAGLPSIPPL